MVQYGSRIQNNTKHEISHKNPCGIYARILGRFKEKCILDFDNGMNHQQQYNYYQKAVII